MKFLVSILLVLSFCFMASAAENNNSPNKVQSSEDYDDGGGSIDQSPKTRDPSSRDLPYSDDEIQKNTPENYVPKNMPIDQD